MSRVQLFCLEPSLTKQAHKDDCDINRIMKRWLRDGVLTHVSSAAQTFRDVASGHDYHQLMDTVLDVQDAFDSLPSDVRKRFANDPIMVLDFISDPANTDECVKLGLVTPFAPDKGVETVTSAASDAAPDS